jgi:group II intron reverse transcriptase/maturase
MRNAQQYLETVSSRGERGLELRRVYHNLQNRELFIRAYAKLYTNKGATTPGIDPNDTVDGMSLAKIDKIIADLKAGTYQWQPVRRSYVSKKGGRTHRRPLGLAGWNNKLVQEVIRMILTAYYEPQFSNNSHGFRPGRGCHTALQNILFKWKGTKWFIEVDLEKCFDSLSHTKLMAIINRNIKDERFLKLLKGMLQAGYLENWIYHRTYSGAPQGSVCSPILANVFMNELDTYIEQELIPEYTSGKLRQVNPDYAQVAKEIRRAQSKGDIVQYQQLAQKRRTIPYGDPYDPTYRRLKYVRYADDLLLGFVGPKSEAVEIKHKIGTFLQTLELKMSGEKTLITHATTGRARFLGYDIHMAYNNTRLRHKRRSINGSPLLSVPPDVVKEHAKQYTRNGKPRHKPELTDNADYDIVTTYNLEFQGLVNYYTLAHDVATKLYPLKWVCRQSLVKTLADKHKKTAGWVYRNYYHKQENNIKAIVIEISREDRKPLIAKFGAKPIRFDKGAVIEDQKPPIITPRNELVTRLLTNQCELCGSNETINVHHIRKLKDLKRRYQGRKVPPKWAIKMMAIRRKTLVVCSACHQAIHAGTYDGPKLK